MAAARPFLWILPGADERFLLLEPTSRPFFTSDVAEPRDASSTARQRRVWTPPIDRPPVRNAPGRRCPRFPEGHPDSRRDGVRESAG